MRRMGELVMVIGYIIANNKAVSMFKFNHTDHSNDFVNLIIKKN